MHSTPLHGFGLSLCTRQGALQCTLLMLDGLGEIQGSEKVLSAQLNAKNSVLHLSTDKGHFHLAGIPADALDALTRAPLLVREQATDFEQMINIQVA
ncbi:hypothetical protein [Geopseudomonas aromaticivorans]